MSIKIEVKSSEVKVVKGKHGANEGKTFRIPEIHAYATISGERHPTPIILGIPAPKEKDDKTGHYQPGVYRLGAASFYVANRELRLRDHAVLLSADAPSSQLILRLTVHGMKTATRKDGTLVTVLDCDVYLPNESYPAACYIEPRDELTKPGEYVVGPESFDVENRKLRLVSKPHLMPAQQPAQQFQKAA